MRVKGLGMKALGFRDEGLGLRLRSTRGEGVLLWFEKSSKSKGHSAGWVVQHHPLDLSLHLRSWRQFGHPRAHETYTGCKPPRIRRKSNPKALE